MKKHISIFAFVFLVSSMGLAGKNLLNAVKKGDKKAVEEQYLNFIHNGNSSVLFYSLEYDFNENTYLVINFTGEPQKILLSHHQLTYGLRTYLTCGCGYKTNTLYLKNNPESTLFSCFKCHRLRYRSTVINTRSDHGQMLYLANKRAEIINMRENIPRPLYRSKWTKRFSRFVKLCVQAGMLDQVIGAEITMDAIKKYQSSSFRRIQ